MPAFRPQARPRVPGALGALFGAVALLTIVVAPSSEANASGSTHVARDTPDNVISDVMSYVDAPQDPGGYAAYVDLKDAFTNDVYYAAAFEARGETLYLADGV